MITVSKKQASLALVVVVFATIMITGSVASSTGSAFANRDRHNSEHFNNFDHFNHFNNFDHFSHNFIHSHHHGKTSSIDQSIGQACGQDARSFGAAFGTAGGVVASGNNIPVCVNANLAGNSAFADQGGH